MLAALATAIVAEVLLFAVWSLAVLDDLFAVAVITGDDSSEHPSILSFDLDPLPDFGSASPVIEEGSELVRIGGLPPGLEDKVSHASSIVPLVLLPHNTDSTFTGLDENTVQQSLNARLNRLTDYVEQTVDLFV